MANPSKQDKNPSGPKASGNPEKVSLERLVTDTPRLALLRIGAAGGAITGASMVLFLLGIQWFTDTNPLTPVRDLAIGLQILGMVFTFWYIKNARPKGQFQFWEGLFVGFVISLVAGLVQGGFALVHLNVLSPEVLEGFKTWSMEFAARNADATKEQFTEQGVEALRKSIAQMTAGDVALDLLLKRVIMAIIVVPIVAAIMRKTVLLVPVEQNQAQNS